MPDALLEIMLTQEHLRNQLTPEQREVLDQQIYQNYLLRSQYPDLYGAKEVSPAYNCQMEIMESMKYEDKSVKFPYTVNENTALAPSDNTV